jgi:hypothetical protein
MPDTRTTVEQKIRNIRIERLARALAPALVKLRRDDPAAAAELERAAIAAADAIREGRL